MARQRFIWPDLWEDESLGSLTPAERLLFIALFSNADDEGRLAAGPANLRALAFRFDEFTLNQVQTMRNHIVAAVRSVHLYHVPGQGWFIQLTSWPKRQHPKYPQPSRLPGPEQGVPWMVEPHDSSNEPPVQEKDTSEVTVEPEVSCSVGWDGLGRDGIGERSLVHADGANGSNPPAVEPAARPPDPFAADFETWWATYPRKQDKQKARVRYQARRRAGLSAADLLAAARHLAAAGRERQYVPMAKTFLGADVTEWVAGIPDGERATGPPDGRRLTWFDQSRGALQASRGGETP